MTEDDRDWILAVFGDVTADPEVKRRVMAYAAELRSEDDPAVHVADVDAARAYLKTSLLRRSVLEIQGMTALEFASLWARGALGAARYRAAGSGRTTRRTKADEPAQRRARRGAGSDG